MLRLNSVVSVSIGPVVTLLRMTDACRPVIGEEIAYVAA
jgi:hypothetical protein